MFILEDILSHKPFEYLCVLEYQLNFSAKIIYETIFVLLQL